VASLLRPYSDVLRVPGAWQFSASAFVARVPMAMLGIGIVLLVTSYRGSYADAGVVAAAAVATGSLAAPLQARVADRYGQQRVLAPLLVVHAVALTGVVLAVTTSQQLAVIGVVAAIAGASLPKFDAFVRVRWAHVLTGTGRLPTAFALESVLDEVVFIVGPVAVTLVATTVDPALAVLGTLLFTVGGGVAFLACRSSVPGTVPRHADTAREPLPWRTLLPLIGAFAALGTAFGAIEVSVVAFTEEAGQPAAAGLVLAAFAAGSLVAGIVFGARAHGPPTRSRLVAALGVLAAALALTLLVTSTPALAGTLALAGVAISPSLITGFGLAERAAARSRVTESIAWATTALGIGVAVGAALAGPVIDERGAAAAFAVPLLGAALGVGLALLLPGSDRRGPSVDDQRVEAVPELR
jgi:predicted MFS family arabinose efflux permease